MAAHKKLVRRPQDGMIAGVAAGVAETYDIDPTLVRLAFVAVAIVSGGIAIFGYLAAALIMPRADEQPGVDSLKSGVDDLISRGKDLYSETRRVIDRPSGNSAGSPPATPTASETPAPPKAEV
jgi:phage shock protein C